MTPLDALELKVHDELERIEALPATWLPTMLDDQGNPCPQVTIVGAGLSGLGIAFGLMRRGVRDILIIDERPAGQEGPWVTTARMKTLRSPKHLASVDLGVPALTMRSWFEAVYGAPAWEALDKPSKEDWMLYLNWFRKVTGIEVQNDTRMETLAPAETGAGIDLTLTGPEGTRLQRTARVVLATGIDGGGGPYVPPEIKALPKTFYTHSGEWADDSVLKGKDIAVIGGATSSFDWAVTALEQGAASVVQLARSPGMPVTEILAWTNFPGFLGHLADLPTAERWRFMHRYFGFKIPPTQDQYDRACSYDNYRIVTGTGANRYSVEGDKVRIENARGNFTVDHLLLATGYSQDPALRPELATLAAHAATWADCYTPPAGEEDALLAAHPYLGPGFEMTPKAEGDDWVARVHVFNFAAVPSLGPICNGITGLKYGVPRIVEALVGHLFEENAAYFLDALERYDDIHFDPRGRINDETEAKAS